MHVLDASKTDGDIRDIDVYSPDTDIFVLLIDLVANNNIEGNLNFITGKGKSRRRINIHAMSNAIGLEKSRGLIGFHAFTGADWGGKFATITKNRWIKRYLCLESTSDVVVVFQHFGEPSFNMENASTILESFVCIVYAETTNCRSVKELRWELFQSKKP